MKLVHRLISLFVLLPLALAIVVFTILNRAPVEVDLFVGRVSMPLFLTVLGALVFGILLGLGIAWMSAGAWRRRARSGERKARALEGEVGEMRRVADADAADTPGAAAQLPARRRLAPRLRALLND